ncbi:MAG: tRNA-dihydrouridine synthase, partial [Candidatus Stygibacter frigidus]|nr:tRNA-dihydrouridine synthase [Candidatus Stygibacter frigidus]
EINDFKALMPEVPVIASVFATKAEDFEELARHVNDSKADFIELNLSCPNVMDEFGMPLAGSIDMVKDITSKVKNISKIPMITKLSPNVSGLTDIALAAQDAGADALCMINTLGPGMLIDIDMVKPVLSNRTGGLSGACVKPIALRAVYEAYSRVKIPIIGTGGVESGNDAVEMLMSGAALVGVGSAVYQGGIAIFEKINQGIRDYMAKYNYVNIAQIPRLEKLNEQA